MLNIMKDGHVHTPFCPHGTSDSFEQYIHEAIKIGRKEISFTEHFPMPLGVTTPEFHNECVMLESQIPLYIKSINQLKEKFKSQIKINVGFEIDYIEGKEAEIQELLEQYGEKIEDSILSVHFIKLDDKYYAIDYLPEFEVLFKKVGDIEKIYDLYYMTLLKSINADIGKYKPRRIGHPSLIRIFNKKYPCKYKNYKLLEEIVLAIKDKEYEVDYNVAGLRKEYCKEIYPSGELLRLIQDYGIPMVYGTDSHKSEDIRS